MKISVIGKNIQIDSVESLAVENDNFTETITFILDRFQSEIDLSTLYGFIIYSNPLGTRLELLDTSFDDDKVYANWSISRAVTAINGRFDFCITFISSSNYDDISKDVKVWTTNIAHSKIMSSLVGDDYAVPEEPIIIQILKSASQMAEIERTVKINAQKTEDAANRAQLLIDSLIQMIDEINGESITYVDSIDSINGEVI